MKDAIGICRIDREKYAKLMADNMATLRTKLGLSQQELAEAIGMTRQTISATETGVRPLSWTCFLSVLFVFMQNKETKILLKALGIYTDELADAFVITDLEHLK